METPAYRLRVIAEANWDRALINLVAKIETGARLERLAGPRPLQRCPPIPAISPSSAIHFCSKVFV